MDTKENFDFNSEIYSSIMNFRVEFEKNKKIEDFIKSFLAQKDLDILFGDMGVLLKQFLYSIDITHPELPDFLEKNIKYAAIDEINQIIELNKYCKRKKNLFLNSRFYSLCRDFAKENLGVFGRTVGDPLLTKMHTRFLPKEKIWKARESKKEQVINIMSKNKDLLENQNGDFRSYHHNSLNIVDLKNDLKNKKEIFDKMNCSFMSAQINHAISKLEKEITLQSFGFHRITLSTVASNIKSSIQFNNDVYIKPVVEEMVSDNKTFLSKIVNLCDNAPSLENKYSLFDHYAIVLPKNDDLGIIVGERDCQTYFIGYKNHE